MQRRLVIATVMNHRNQQLDQLSCICIFYAKNIGYMLIITSNRNQLWKNFCKLFNNQSANLFWVILDCLDMQVLSIVDNNQF